MHASPPDTTENCAVVSGRDDAGFDIPEARAAGHHRDVDRVEAAAKPVGHLELQDRAPEDRRDHIGGTRDREQHQPDRAATR